MTFQIPKTNDRARVHLQIPRLSTVPPCGGPPSWELWHHRARHRPPPLKLMEKPVLALRGLLQEVSCKCSLGSCSFGKCFSLWNYLTAWKMEPGSTALAPCQCCPEPLAEGSPQHSWCSIPAGLRLPDLGRCSESQAPSLWHRTFFTAYKQISVMLAFYFLFFGSACGISGLPGWH